jgi:agmatine deiminase
MTPAPFSTPSALGYRMPAEWEPHDATWLTFPRPDGISFPNAYGSIPAYWARMTSELCAGEEVHINLFDDQIEGIARQALAKAGLGGRLGSRIFLHRFPAYEPWCRDHGPVFVRRRNPATGRGELAVVDWRYNAWGGKYPPYDLDDAVPQHVARWLNLPLFSPDWILEGGSIDVNGQGTVLTTEQCLLHENRNAPESKAEVETWLRDFLGAEKVLWLGEGIVGDDTDGHIDDITRFVAPQAVVTCVEEDPLDDNYELLRENRRRLQGMSTARGEPLEILDLPMPGVVEKDGQRLPASYANFYIGNEVVLLPVYRHPNDARAMEVLENCFPGRRIVAIDGVDLIWGLGSFHCVTQQQPSAD